MQKWCTLEKGPWSYARMKRPFYFLLSIYSRCGRWLSWPHNITVCLDFSKLTCYYTGLPICSFSRIPVAKGTESWLLHLNKN